MGNCACLRRQEPNERREHKTGDDNALLLLCRPLRQQELMVRRVELCPPPRHLTVDPVLLAVGLLRDVLELLVLLVYRCCRSPR